MCEGFQTKVERLREQLDAEQTCLSALRSSAKELVPLMSSDELEAHYEEEEQAIDTIAFLEEQLSNLG